MTRLVHIHLAGGAHLPSLLNSQNVADLHPAATNLHILAEAGLVHIVQCAGPLLPNGSHFNMTRGQQDIGDFITGLTGEGWGDAALAKTFPDATGLLGVAVGDTVLPRVLQGGKAGCVALRQNFTDPSDPSALIQEATAADDLPDYWRDILIKSYGLMGELVGLNLEFGSLGRTIAEVFAENATVRMVSAVSGGFDTHTDHAKQFATSLSIFDATLGEYARAEGWLPMPDPMGSAIDGPHLDGDSLVIVTTDFSRDLISTSGDGYSHGRGGFVLLIGPAVVGGLTGTMPSLTFEPERLLEGSGEPRFLPVDYPTPNVVLGALEAIGWETDGLFLNPDYAPLRSPFDVVEEPPVDPPVDPVETAAELVVKVLAEATIAENALDRLRYAAEKLALLEA